jgi:dihydroneopterin aldolase
MGRIALTGMEFHAFHGCFKEEQIIGTNFIVDLLIETDTSAPELTDELKDTLDYSKVYKIVKGEMEITAKLLEHVARRILNSLIKSFPQITFAGITLSKMNPPLGGKVERVSVTLNSKDNG